MNTETERLIEMAYELLTRTRITDAARNKWLDAYLDYQNRKAITAEQVSFWGHSPEEKPHG